MMFLKIKFIGMTQNALMILKQWLSTPKSLLYAVSWYYRELELFSEQKLENITLVASAGNSWVIKILNYKNWRISKFQSIFFFFGF